MIIKIFIFYIFIQWIFSIFLSYSLKVNSFALDQFKRMRQISFLCIICSLVLITLGMLELLNSTYMAYLVVPVIGGLIIISIFYSTLTFMFIFNTTHEFKKSTNQIIRILLLFFLPIGVFLLKIKKQYSID